jgi:hypothetical protein
MRLRGIAVAAVLLMALTLSGAAKSEPPKMSPEQVREERAYAAGVQTAIWGRPFVDNVHTLFAGLKVGAVGLNYYRKFPNLKTAADKFVNTPNNVSIDGYGRAEKGDVYEMTGYCRLDDQCRVVIARDAAKTSGFGT